MTFRCMNGHCFGVADADGKAPSAAYCPRCGMISGPDDDPVAPPTEQATPTLRGGKRGAARPPVLLNRTHTRDGF